MSLTRMVPTMAFVLTTLSTSGLASDVPFESVRVRIFADANIERVEFQSAGRDSLLFFERGQKLVALAPEQTATLEVWQGMLRVRWDQGSAPVSRCSVAGAAVTRVSPDRWNDRLYRGNFDIELSGGPNPVIQVVNEVGVEDYVASVLPSEYPFSEIEGVKAQAIVIRTYALTAASRGSTYQLDDNANSQVYLGVAAETELSRRAAQMTAGAIVQYKGSPIEAVYSSHCGGHSANNEDIWGTNPVPYLRGRKDPYDDDAPVSEWSSRVDAKEFLQRLSNALDLRVNGIEVSTRGAGRHVKSVRLDVDDGPDEEMRGEQFRALANRAWGRAVLLSSAFEIKKRSGDYEFKGRGNGHGVGFCQWGAAEQAKQGKGYRDILSFYYRDVDVSSVEPVSLASEVSTPSNKSRVSRPKRLRRRPGW